jgi:hypothetical protein
LQIEEKELKKTFSGTSCNKGTPFTVNFPSDKSNKDSVLMRSRVLEFTGSLGEAMKGEKRKRTEEKQSKKNKGRKSGEVKNLTGM